MGKAVLQLFLVLAALGLTLDLSAQCQELQTVSGQPVSFSIFSAYPPSLSSSPDHGEVTWEEFAPLAYEVTYVSDPGFGAEQGAFDDFGLISFPLAGGINIGSYCVSVGPVIIQADHDIALTTANAPVIVNVTQNDFSTTGSFELESVSVTNNGTAEIIGDLIRFTPSAGFSGLTDLDYVICALGVCDVGTVSINVLENNLSFPLDTVSVFTKRGKEQLILVPENFLLSEEPIHGLFNTASDVPSYQPDADYLGLDFITFTNEGGDEIVYRIEMLDLEDNLFTQEDQFYTTADTDILLRPLYNDLYGNLAGCVSYGLPQFGSLLPSDNPAEMVYQPLEGWTGIDQVVYTSYPPGCVDEPETETIYIIVSNFEPEDDEVTLYPTTGSTLRLTYELPAYANVSWSITSSPEHGEAYEQDGHLYYQAPQNPGSDQLTINYCLQGDDETGDECLFSKSVTIDLTINPHNGVSCEDDCVWPGDANADGVVDLSDLLPIGLHMGSYGTSRDADEPGLWCAQSSADWGTSNSTNVDLKHADTDGNRFIDHRDTQLIRQNLGLAHQLRPRVPQLDGFDVYLQGDVFAEPGELVALDIMIGNTGAGYVGTEDLYGFRLPFIYSPDFIDPGTVSVEFLDEAWTSYDSPVISMVHNDPTGKLEAVYSRTNGIATNGFGKVGTMYVGTEDLYGFRPGDEPITITIGGGEGRVMTGAGHLNSVDIQPFELTILPPLAHDEDISTEELAATLNEDLLAFPNPTDARLTVHLNGGREFSDFVLSDLSGRTVLEQHGLQTNHRVLDLSQLPNGLYSLRVTTVDGVVTRKVELLR